MRPLTFDDLLPLSEYAGQRHEFFEANQRYLDRYRRIRIGPSLTLLFENRQTLWFRVQELLRVARLVEPTSVQQELDLYNRLLPRRDRLQAALLIEVSDQARLSQELAFWQKIQGDHLRLCIGDQDIPALLVTCRPEDRCVGTAHWVQFAVPPAQRQLLIDFAQPARFEMRYASYRHESPFLSDEVRQSLHDDLQMSDKDAQASA
ncbi:MAG: DUF3501 family protein [Gemmataceae bacterium]|nr:DUF3501 family protein [Gemmataceae bacterium]